jgi:hypothetical protein
MLIWSLAQANKSLCSEGMLNAYIMKNRTPLTASVYERPVRFSEHIVKAGHNGKV